MNRFQISREERAAYKALYSENISIAGGRAISSGSYWTLEDEHPSLRNIEIPQKNYIRTSISNINSCKSPKKRAEAVENAQRDLRRLEDIIYQMHERVLQEEFEESYFTIYPPTIGMFDSPSKACFTYSWKDGESWKSGNIEFFRDPDSKKPSIKGRHGMAEIEEWHAKNREFLINLSYYQLRDYLAEMETGEGLPTYFNLNNNDRLLPPDRHYNQWKYLQ